MDFFSSSFNATRVLNDLRISDPIIESTCFESLDKFEQHLWCENATLVAQLQKVEDQENLKKGPLTGPSR